MNRSAAALLAVGLSWVGVVHAQEAPPRAPAAVSESQLDRQLELRPEPSGAELRAAYEGHLRRLNADALEWFGPRDGARLALTLERLDKLECEQVDPDAQTFTCRVEVRTRAGERRARSVMVHLLVAPAGDGWAVR